MADSAATVHQQSPQQSIDRLSAELDISRSSLQRILQENGYKAYHPKLIHGLVEDTDRQLQRCQRFISQFDNDSQLSNKIMWSDEASFKLNSMINHHNCVIYTTENPNLTYEQRLNQPGFTVWGSSQS
ncbi:uncharacterized protein LOC118765318 [Octopus sinensis]|uniref:Uncharacterized protein LOC118765318 n=1 Tax=Octopus sinensis TaxID=2607531 RepID=A0A7E6F5A7_9MOLL|nr:uncharacterized protein LOC118765318 [Octopus sinensis]